MDVNGTKFHLVYGEDDWASQYPADIDKTLAEAWRDGDDVALEWDRREQGLQLAQQAPLFRRAREREQVPIDNRRGSAADTYENWYWINQTRDGIRFLAKNNRESQSFWHSSDAVALCEDELLDEFTVCLPEPPPNIILQGLAVTEQHYLVVGNVTERGLLIFDLHRGSPPTLMQFPETVDFEPWDMVATDDGGLLILDRVHKTYWYLDKHLRLLATVTDEAADFQPEGQKETAPNRDNQVVTPEGYSIAETIDPISIAPGPDGHVLILDTPPAIEGEEEDEASSIHEYDGDTLVETYSLAEIIRAVDRNDPNGESILYSVRANDFAYNACAITAPCANDFNNVQAELGHDKIHMLYVVEERGNQAIAFQMMRETMRLEPMPDYLPMRRWQEKAIVRAGEHIYYDFEDRWIRLQVFDDCHYAKLGTFVTPTDFIDGIPEQPFDSNIPNCTWHRLLLDAHIPVGTFVRIRARAADDYSLLEQTPWISQPQPYARVMAADLPYYDPQVNHRRHIETQLQANQELCVTEEQVDNAQPESIKLWEILFQGVQGRYLQLEITLEGTSRSTPTLFAMRVWYPRFSYSEQYLPAIYREDPAAAHFIERWLANFEGFYTTIEDMIEQVYFLFDPQTAHPDALDWLASWMGLVLDPLWSEKRRRFFISHLYRLYQMRGTPAGLEAAIRMYTDHESDLSPELFDFKNRERSRVRVIEHFLTRNVDADETLSETQRIAVAAHRFTVLLPHDLSDEEVLMAERIIDIEKPAHTDYALKRYWDVFRVGEARLGLDTELGDSRHFVPYQLGNTYIPDGYLAYQYPFDIEDRIVMGRDYLDDSSNRT